MSVSSINTCANRLFDIICLWILPAGFFLLLSALFFLPDRSLHHKLFYSLFSIPTLLVVLLRPKELIALFREPIIVAFALFATYAIISLAWSTTETGASSLIKRPVHTLMLFLGAGLLLRHRMESLKPILLGAALLALVASMHDLFAFSLAAVAGERFIGSGAFDNPLLSSHLFGFFGTYWLFMCVNSKSLRVMGLCLAAFAVMFAAVLETGSRTPLVAMTLAANWIAVLRWDRRSIPLLVAAPLAVTCILMFAPDLITERGSSYRPEIWQFAWNMFLERPLAGHGYDTPMAVDIGIGVIFSEPHNFALGVLYNVGVLGFLPWIGMIALGLYSGWKNRAEPLFLLASALLVFGIGAGLTEGGGIISRPKEHWFLLWIPLALLAALNIARRHGNLPQVQLRKITANQADQLVQDAQIIEEDGLGPKVLKLKDGTFLKLFRRRRWYTSESLNPYSERFARNSKQLSTQGITTPAVLELLALDDGSRGVRYQPLPGRTLRQSLEAASGPGERRAIVGRLGRFIGQLHQKGVYFRSLHLGNVLLMENDEFGLIDLADMRILPSPLSAGLRQRNLRHMQRYSQDRHWLFEENLQALLDGYDTAVPKPVARVMRAHLQSPAEHAK